MEGMHKNVMFYLEDEHVVKRARNTERHSIRERSLSERIDQEYCRSGSNGCGICNTDPGAHPQAIGQFPLTTHISIDANEEVEYDKLEWPSIIKPFIERSSFPNWVEVKTDRIRTRNNSTGDDVVAIH